MTKQSAMAMLGVGAVLLSGTAGASSYCDPWSSCYQQCGELQEAEDSYIMTVNEYNNSCGVWRPFFEERCAFLENFALPAAVTSIERRAEAYQNCLNDS